MDLEAVGGEEGLSTALLITHERVLAPVCLLVCSQVSRRAVRPGAAFKHALVALHLIEEEEEEDISAYQPETKETDNITSLKNHLNSLKPVFQKSQ